MVVITVFGFGTLVYRVASIALIHGEEYQKRAIQQQLRDTEISPERGTIYDRNMKPLAQSASVWTIVIAPANIKNDEQRNFIADNLAEILNLDRDAIYEKACRNTYYEIIKRKVEEEEQKAVMEFATKNKITCISRIEDYKRYYPYGNFAATVLGFTGVDNQGLYGIEAYYDKQLKGVPGRVVAAKNALGTDMPFTYETMIEAQNGNDLVLTIDEVIQHYLEKYIEIAIKEHNVTNRATGIVMDVNTGEILAMTTKPDFDPNTPFEIFDEAARNRIEALPEEERREAILQEQAFQWRNKAVSDTYEPGSVFKILTAAMCLEEKLTNPNEMFNDTGSIKVADRRYRCWRSGGHGVETFTDAMKNSCNPIFITLAQRLGIPGFTRYFSAFGLTAKTGIDLPGEATGIYHKENEMKIVELASSSFGQTFKVTPIQLITAVSAVANGGHLVEPYVVAQIRDKEGNIIESRKPTVKRQVISQEVSKELCKMLEEVVRTGTGKNAYVPGYRIAGKTGTSEKIDTVDEQGKKSGRISSFCAFAPADDPKIVVLIMLDEPHGPNIGGGTLVGPIVGNFLEDVLPYLGVGQSFTPEELARMDVNAPNTVGKSIDLATKSLKDAGLKARVVGSGTTVIAQIPEAGKPIPRSGTVVLYTDEESKGRTVKVPNFVGLSPSQVNLEATNSGINIRFQGAGFEGDMPVFAYSQSIQPGTRVPLGTVVSVEFRIEDYSG